jgi:hypothetical protein
VVVGLLLCVAAVVFGLLSIRAHKRRATRMHQAQAVARANGFSYSQEDTGACTRVPFVLFRQGDGRGAENVLSGTAPDGAPVRVFDYFFYDEQERANTGGLAALGSDDDAVYQSGHRHYTWFTCCLTEVDSVYPPTVIERRGVLAKVVGALGVRSVQFESDAFNRMFQVTGEDTRFIQHLVDPQIMDLLLGTEGKVRFELRGRWVLAALDRNDVTPDLMMAMVGLTTEFRRRIPNVVRSMTTQLPTNLPPVLPNSREMEDLR